MGRVFLVFSGRLVEEGRFSRINGGLAMRGGV